MIAEFGDHPQARGHVARVMYKEGMYLRNSGRGEEAIQVWDELFSRFGTRPSSTAPSGQLAKKPTSGRDQPSQRGPGNLQDMLRQVARIDFPMTNQRTAAVRPVKRQISRSWTEPPTWSPHPGIATSKLNQGKLP